MTPTPTPVPTSNPPPLRVYTLYLDGMLHTHPFPHGESSGAELDRELSQQFHAWLEMLAPGAYQAGRVSGIRFADLPDEESSSPGPPSGGDPDEGALAGNN